MGFRRFAGLMGHCQLLGCKCFNSGYTFAWGVFCWLCAFGKSGFQYIIFEMWLIKSF